MVLTDCRLGYVHFPTSPPRKLIGRMMADAPKSQLPGTGYPQGQSARGRGVSLRPPREKTRPFVFFSQAAVDALGALHPPSFFIDVTHASPPCCFAFH